MAHKELRIDVRVYLRAEEHEHLKNIAKENGVSLSELIGTAVLKKYPLHKKKARSENLASKIANDIPLVSEQVPLDEPIPKERESQVDDLVSCDVESMTHGEQEARLAEVKKLLRNAYNGERLSKEQFATLMQERDDLRTLLGHK